MPLALLIGFEYNNNSLPGVIIDLYRANKWCESFNCDVHIITDNKILDGLTNRYTSEYINTMTERHDDNTQFIKKSMLNVISNRNDLCTSIKKIFNDATPTDGKIIIYYTGHGIKESLIAPDGSLLPFVDFRDIITDNASPYAEIFCILDCCNPNGMHLPYKLVNNQFVLSSYKVECIKQPMLLITSSEMHEKSIAKRSGSIFSHYLFELLSTLTNRNLTKLLLSLSNSIKKIDTGHPQTVTIYSSYVIDPLLWTWIGSTKNYDIVTDMSLSAIIIRVKDSPAYFNPYDLQYNYSC